MFRPSTFFGSTKNSNGLNRLKPIIKKVQPATPKQIALLERLTEQKELIPDWDAATLTRSEASRIIDKLLKP